MNNTTPTLTPTLTPTPINEVTDSDLKDFSQSNKLSEYQRIATKSAIYPGQHTPKGLMYVALKLNGEAGELAEHVGKAMRDDGFGEFTMNETMNEDVPLTPERRDLIVKEIGDCLWYLSALCNELKITLAYAAWMNLKKLRDRTKRNVLRGSGDER
jgi:NTP pyrophosphatase (non-canonical NTP hydrolase)